MAQLTETDTSRPAVGVTAPMGFVAGVAACGIKEGTDRPDVAVIFSESPATAAGLFTTNLVKAAPVVISGLNLANGSARAVVVNSGNANACTGSQGFKDALLMGKTCADELDVDPSDVLVSSTGVIGRLMPTERVRRGIVDASRALDSQGGAGAARAIMTTDTCPKEAAASFVHHGHLVTIGGMAKGSGMIHVNMATMLGFLTTDASVAPALLRAALVRSNEGTFNMVTVDGDTSTNDMLLLLANGASGAPPVTETDGLPEFEAALHDVCDRLARAIARDGEGATRMFTVTVAGAGSVEDARVMARTVASSSLVKTAIHGGDPNWGRIVAALGRSGCPMVLDRLAVEIGGHVVFRNGAGASDVDLLAVAEAFSHDDVAIVCNLGLGDVSATAYGCDLSADYVRINADYTT